MLPEGWKSVTLRDLVPAEAFHDLERVINQAKRGKVKNVHQALLAVLSPHRAQMEARGALPEYLAYYLENAINNRQI